MKKDLQRIANTLVLYSYHVNNNGLLAGKMGIILFFYRYAQFADNEYYRDFAGDMLDGVLRTAGTTSNDFENGLTGIGWAVNYLLKNNLVEGEVNDVLQDVDKKIFAQVKCDPEVSVFGQGIYLLNRLKDNLKFEKLIPNALDFCYSGLREYKGTISLYHINSILYFLIEIDKTKKYTDKVKSIRNLIPSILKKIWEQKVFDSSDIIIFDNILANVEATQRSQWNQILISRPHDICCKSDTMEHYIRSAWLHELYFGQVNLKKPSSNDIKDFINQKQESITLDDFLFMRGLAGFGYALLSAR